MLLLLLLFFLCFFFFVCFFFFFLFFFFFYCFTLHQMLNNIYIYIYKVKRMPLETKKHYRL